MNITLKRLSTGDQGTQGALTIDSNDFTCDTLELPWRDDAPRASCVPAGEYLVALAWTGHLWSPRPDGKIFQLQNVEGRQAIDIHAATWAGDVSKGWHSDLLGCLALGLSFGMLQPPDVSQPQLAILSSRAALTKFMALVGDGPFQLTILDAV